MAAVTWPLGDLAAHWLLMALVLQRLLLTLAVPPLLVLGTPRPLIARLTRPRLGRRACCAWWCGRSPPWPSSPSWRWPR